MVDGHSAGPDTQLSTPTTSISSFDTEHASDNDSLATTVPETVMAEQVTKDVVKEAQSVGRPAPIDDTASTTNTPAADGELPLGLTTATSTTLEPTLLVTDANSAHATDLSQNDGAATTVRRVWRRRSAGSVLAPGASIQDSDKQLLNGDSAEQAIADASGGSDTDISRPGSVDQSKRDAGHVRTNSMKKPSTFKSVSVTKNFLAKSAVSTPAARPGDKATPAAPASSASLLTAKPRLVAKSGTANAPRSLGKTNGASAGPDASKVWNKNQPVPPAPPKQFTDEELKQQYGIHLATRLQADEAGKEAKWADIDDDEDDWAPDTVQWMDGTKSSGAVQENEAPPVEEPKTILKAPETNSEPAKPAPPATSTTPKSSVTGGTKTILKPGAHAQPAGGRTSLVLKGQPEKPTLVAKPLASEKKSPWATLPPVEKVPPVQINPPAQPPQQRFSQRDSYGYDPMPPLPAKEIAPDDFNRSWRDDRGGRPELFNSHSGRYEPVNEMRRGSMRDSGFRQQPSVLQRPSQDGGPAEPSAAFQTSRSGGDMPTWGRRRNSSNLSGSNGRRMSFDRRPPDMPSVPMDLERRGSHSVNSVEPSESAASQQPSVAHGVSPNVAHAHPASPYGSVASSGAHDTPAAVPVASVEDPVEVQKRLMTDKIERARLKKQQEREAEEKEEAERKERLAKRLAAMGPPKVKEQLPSQAPERSPRKDKAVPATVQSPPKPPVPTNDGEIAQYGMMKVHHAHPVHKSSPTEGSKVPPSAEPAPSSSAAPAHVENQGKPPPSPNQKHVKSPDGLTKDHEKVTQSAEDKNQAQHPESSAPAGPRSQASWQSAAPQARGWTSQVWGPPPAAKDRALGNGTFGSAYDRSQNRPTSQQPVSVQPQSASTGSMAGQPPHQQPTSATPAAQAMHPRPSPLATSAGPSARPGPIAPPPGSGWGDYKAHIAQDDQNMKVKARQDLERMGGETFRPEIRETYKDQRGQSQTTLHDKVAGNKVLPNGPKKDETKLVYEGPSPPQALSQGPLQQTNGPRASRFFPRSTEPVSHPAPTLSSKVDSPPPPPETESHPAFTSSTGTPLVRLPKPSPVVRLPPPFVGGAVPVETPVSMPPRGGPGLGARPLAMNPEWQARFNKLLEKPGTSSTQAAQAATTRSADAVAPALPSRLGSLPVTASSKAALEVRGPGGSATVSLPNAPAKRIFAEDRGKDVITRRGTEALFEDREFGSLPTVRLSKVSHLAANEPAVAASTDDTVLIKFKKIENPFTQRRLESFDIERTAQKIDVIVRLNNMSEAISKSMPRPRRGVKTTGQYNKPKRSNVTNGSPSSVTKDRPHKPSQQGQSERPSNSSRPSTANAWNNNRSTPASTPTSTSAHQATTWARRAAAPVH
ncbi:hypothetical protein EK21DRAFT_63068 [Setomelanomma holmii]|uniref:Uncharacterized protein n=1 Tax=Setomelanomma holmii TaxID=210430 RepID=A0A9P4HBI1_9PLEO|nr:hypothetical protein EK21DRAFT_63068 [Setomelanomma holmii]